MLRVRVRGHVTLARGMRVDGYRIEGVLRAGEFGVVYRARTADGYPVALEVLHGAGAGDAGAGAGAGDGRSRGRAVAVHVDVRVTGATGEDAGDAGDALAAIEELMETATHHLEAAGFAVALRASRSLVLALPLTGARARDAAAAAIAQLPGAMAADGSPLVSWHAAVHVDDAITIDGVAAGGSLLELWRWTSARAQPGVVLTPRAAAELRLAQRRARIA